MATQPLQRQLAGPVTLICAMALILSHWAVSAPAGEPQSPSQSSASHPENAGRANPRWWKGNLHTHTLWSDGNDFPEMVAAWYADHDYNFLALSDHNILSRGEKWLPLATIMARSDEQVLVRYQARFGLTWVDLKGTPDQADCQVRLKPLDEFRRRVELADRFIMLEGEEISDKVDGKPVHMNASNLLEPIQPVSGASVQEAMQNNLRLILEQEKATGRQILPHLNHPNFHYAITAADIAKTVQERFFEVFNGHPGVNQLGDAQHPSIDKMWDMINAMRLVWLEADPIYGIGTDDSHVYNGKPGAHTGRGWVMVRSEYLTPEYLIKAMKAGDFYASSGVVLEDVKFDTNSRTLSLKIAPAQSASFKTEFIVLPKDANLPSTTPRGKPEGKVDDSPEGSAVARPLPEAKVAAVVDGLEASFALAPGDYYVRAVVTSSLPHVDPSWPDQKQQAWTQPVGWQKQ